MEQLIMLNRRYALIRRTSSRSVRCEVLVFFWLFFFYLIIVFLDAERTGAAKKEKMNEINAEEKARKKRETVLLE